jgi:hypothetical protein
LFEKFPTEVYRKFSMKRLGNTQTPRLRGLTLNNRVAVLWSGEDLSTGIVGVNVDGITGYTPTAATRIVRNIIKDAAK